MDRFKHKNMDKETRDSEEYKVLVSKIKALYPRMTDALCEHAIMADIGNPYLYKEEIKNRGKRHGGPRSPLSPSSEERGRENVVCPNVIENAIQVITPEKKLSELSIQEK